MIYWLAVTAYCIVAGIAWGWRVGVGIFMVTLCGYVIGARDRRRGARREW